MEKLIMNEEYHQSFLKNLLVVAIGTVVFMISSHYLVDYYYNYNKNTTVFTSASPENTGK